MQLNLVVLVTDNQKLKYSTGKKPWKVQNKNTPRDNLRAGFLRYSQLPRRVPHIHGLTEPPRLGGTFTPRVQPPAHPCQQPVPLRRHVLGPVTGGTRHSILPSGRSDTCAQSLLGPSRGMTAHTLGGSGLPAEHCWNICVLGVHSLPVCQVIILPTTLFPARQRTGLDRSRSSGLHYTQTSCLTFLFPFAPPVQSRRQDVYHLG